MGDLRDLAVPSGLPSYGDPRSPEPDCSAHPLAAAHCLGPFRFEVEGVDVQSWRSARARAVLLYLVTHRGRPVSRDVLIQAIWPDAEGPAVRSSLKVAIHSLRQTLGRAGGRSGVDVVAREGGYQLETRHLWVDVDEFEQLYAEARRCEAAGRRERALASYARAVELYRGDFLEELSDDWPSLRRETLRDQCLYMLTCLASAEVEAGSYEGAICRCRQILALDRCHESAYRTLVLCHGRLGQRGRARCWYELCVRTLRAELDCAPLPETERVYQMVIAGRA